jgi:hypothetical protein
MRDDRAAEQATAAQVRALAMADVHATDGHDPRPAVLTATPPCRAKFPLQPAWCELPTGHGGPHEGRCSCGTLLAWAQGTEEGATPLEAADSEADYIREQYADARAEYDREGC